MQEIVSVPEVISNLVNLLPLFHQKIIRPYESLAKHSLSPLQHYTITLLNDKKILSMKAMSEEMNVSKSQLTPLIDNLIEMGYLNRETSREDRRIINVFLTEKGNDYLQKMHIEHSNFLLHKFGNVPQERLKTLNTAINEIKEFINMLE